MKGKNEMRRTKKLIALLLVLITISGCFSMGITAMAAETAIKTIKLLDQKSYALYYGSTKTYKFSIPVSSTVYASFTGQDTKEIWGDKNAYYKYDVNVTIKDSDNSTIKKATININSKDKKRVYVDLKKGDYKIVISVPKGGDDGFFNFSLYEKLTKEYPTKTLTLNKSSVTVNYDTEEPPVLKATQNPSYTTDNLTWSTSNKYIATVKDGVVEPLRLGKVTITAKSGTKTAKCTVNIKSMPLIVTMDDPVQYLKKYVKYVENAEGGKWSSSDKNVATVSSTGKITAKKIGECFITFKTTDGKYYKFYVVVAYPVMITNEKVYRTSSSRGIEFTLMNCSEKTVESVKIGFEEYDFEGQLTRNDKRSFTNMQFKSLNEKNIRCKINANTAYYGAYIYQVKFTDGTIWKVK